MTPTAPQAEQGDLQFDGHGKGGLSGADKDFLDFHDRNPHVYATLLRLARSWKERGRGKAGIAMLFEVLRWEYAMNTTDEDFKLNNNLKSRYARLLMEQEPELAGLFEIRELRT